jgi:phytoene dehydrogenase-like protein
VVIVGAGMAGLCCARVLAGHNVPCVVLEASDDVGGRIRTDTVDFFKLDRGFQVYLTAYPEGPRFLELEKLTLNKFDPGAIVRFDGAFHKVLDPRRRPEKALTALFTPVAGVADKMHLLNLILDVTKGDPYALLQRDQRTTLDHLKLRGFGDTITERFFKPFFAGVFLEDQLSTSSRLFEFTFRMFATGDSVLPTGGMGVLPRHVAAKLPAGTVMLRTPAASVERERVTLHDGTVVRARAVVIAADPRTSAALLGKPDAAPAFHATANIYFAADRSPVGEPILTLNATGQGLVNNLAVPSDVAPSYAPPGAALVSVSTVGVPDLTDDQLVARVRDELADWYGPDVHKWKHLRTYRIHEALPTNDVPDLASYPKPARVYPGVYAAGDWLATASTNGAMASGRRAAEAVLEDLR